MRAVKSSVGTSLVKWLSHKQSRLSKHNWNNNFYIVYVYVYLLIRIAGGANILQLLRQRKLMLCQGRLADWSRRVEHALEILNCVTFELRRGVALDLLDRVRRLRLTWHGRFWAWHWLRCSRSREDCRGAELITFSLNLIRVTFSTILSLFNKF